VLSQGDEIDVTVVEVDKERGRIGLRLTEDPDVAGKSAEELSSVGTGDPGPPRRDGGRRGRDGGGRGRDGARRGGDRGGRRR
jgi:polyribonucleotide nucleotidyltransferase